jgi:hypothetical protein
VHPLAGWAVSAWLASGCQRMPTYHHRVLCPYSVELWGEDGFFCCSPFPSEDGLACR